MMAKNRTVAAFLLCLLASAGAAKEIHPITKRRIAQPPEPPRADWLMRPEREAEDRPDDALDAIGIPRGGTVADVGAGAGYYTGRLGERVGPQGIVYGEDIRQSLLDQMMTNIRQRGLKNVRTLLGTAEDPRLPPGAIDLVLLVNTYHEMSEPEKMIDAIRESLKPGGRLVLLEYRSEDRALQIPPEQKMTVKQMQSEIEPQGFRLEKTVDTLPRQHLVVFLRP